jgi:diaminohydroxyphosphoribosylaminopyrimidine deaminase/5-amino-6-(5-phosphoribosylamino)uracil reductase
MGRALALARRGRYTTAPNPAVGAVVARGGRVVAEGWHRRAGGPHAEAEALGRLKGRGPATLYVTLEPCVHQGRTPPCVDAILASPVDRVVVAAPDPDPRVDGRGIAALRRAGLAVEVGLMRREAEFLNRSFLHFKRTGLPFVIVKSAMTLDGRIADRAGRSRWITAPAARLEGKRLREEADAILVGSGTVLADDPGLGRLREHPPRPPLLKVVLDPEGRVRPGARLFRGGGVVWVVGSGAAVAATPEGASLLRLPAPRGRFPLRRLLKALAAGGVQTLLVEGGGETAGRFLEAGLAQEAALFYGMKLIGGGVDGVAGFALPLARAWRFRPFLVRRPGGDLYLRGAVCSRG